MSYFENRLLGRWSVLMPFCALLWIFFSAWLTVQFSINGFVGGTIASAGMWAAYILGTAQKSRDDPPKDAP